MFTDVFSPLASAPVGIRATRTNVGVTAGPMAVLLDLEGEDQTADHLPGKQVRCCQRRCADPDVSSTTRRQLDSNRPVKPFQANNNTSPLSHYLDHSRLGDW